MDHVWELNAAATPPAAPAIPLLGYPTEIGSPTNPGAWWYHMITEELRNAIIAAGLTPNATELNQLAAAIASQVGVQQNLYASASAGGTADALTASFTPAITSTTLAAGNVTLAVRSAIANATTAPTFTPNSGVITAEPIVKGSNQALVAGDIAGAGHWLWLTWDATLSKWVLLNPATGVGVPNMKAYFEKADANTVAFTKTAAATLSVKAGTGAQVNGHYVSFVAATAVIMPALVAGSDYAVYVCDDGTIRADSNWSAPTGYTTTNSRKVGGFHYGLVTAGLSATIANGFNITASATRNGTTASASKVITGLASTADLMAGMCVSGTGIGVDSIIDTVDSVSQVTLTVNSTAAATVSLTFKNTGMVWTQADVDAIAGINVWSLWDLKFRPLADPRGMVLVNGRFWVDIYLCSTDTAANGTSKYNTNIASFTVLPKIPAAFGGDGTVTYPSLNWWVANELAGSNKKRLMWESEFVQAAFGVIENHSLDTTASTYPTTTRCAGYTSKWGIEQAAGVEWTWGQDSNFYGEVASPVYTYKSFTGNSGAIGSERGQAGTFGTYGLVRVLLGGTRTLGVISGSRASNWNNYPWYSGWGVGLRAASDHLILG
jgi:hypothetical protein